MAATKENELKQNNENRMINPIPSFCTHHSVDLIQFSLESVCWIGEVEGYE
jgi:hypothetical protein